MKLAVLFSAGALLSGLGSGPALAHHCGHHDCDYGRDHSCDHSRGQVNAAPPSRGGPADWSVNLKSLEGKIVEIIYLPGATPETGMVELRVRTAVGANLVRLAPAGFLKQSGLRLEEGDSVTLKAFPVSGMKGDLLVATEVDGSGRNIQLRDASGQPLW